MNDDQLFRGYAAYDGLAQENIERAVKAQEKGQFEKATAYALIAQAYQAERDNVVRLSKGGWGR